MSNNPGADNRKIRQLMREYLKVNLCSDEVMVNATHYSPAEILFFKKMVRLS